MSRGWVVPGLLGLVCWGVGCGGDAHVAGRQHVYPAKGKVLYNHAPLVRAFVNFQSDSGKISAYGTTDEEGRFTLTTYRQNDGAVAGVHTVTVKKTEGKAGASNDPSAPRRIRRSGR